MEIKIKVPWNKGKIGSISKEAREKMSKSHKGKTPWITGKKHNSESLLKMGESHKKSWSNPEIRKRIIEAQKKVWLNPELREKLSNLRKGRKHSEEWKKEMSKRNSGENNPFFGKKHSEETREKLRKSHQGPKPWLQGKKLSEEHKNKLSQLRKGKTPWNKGKKMDKPSPMKGKHHTEESKEKNRLAHLGRTAWNKGKPTGLIPWNKGLKGKLIHSEESKLKIRERRAKQVFPIKDSQPEIKVQNFLKQLNIEFISHKYITEIKHRYQCDIFIPISNTIIEIDGDYWHGNIKNPRFKTLNEHQIKAIEKDKIRTKELQEKGFKVLRLWESDIERMDINEFKERLTSS